MDDMVRWLMLGLGIVYFITESAIFAIIRVPMTKGSMFRSTLFYCPACTGFWVGCALVALWPFSVLDQGVWPFLVSAMESGFAMMVVASSWSSWRGGNPAYDVEAELRGEMNQGAQHDAPKEEQDGRS